ncbi:MAG TPA: hypothetical protein EYG57_09405 [Planctomycetes bacterium]|nr:hypothetical protein [Planctomycetaceae bacterium]HIM29763.1 hypothetical protein [Planctomycetota bacterium]
MKPSEAVDKDRNLEFATVFWLNLNERQPIFVPAESRYRLQLRTPYADEWGDVLMRDQSALPAGGEFERGEVVFPACLRVAVRVTDPSGTPVEGIPVRLLQEQSRVSTVAHNTTAAGDAFFFIDPNSSGHFSSLSREGNSTIWKNKRPSSRSPTPIRYRKPPI